MEKTLNAALRFTGVLLLLLVAGLAAAQTNIAPSGQGYYWYGMTSATGSSHQTASSVINDSNLSNTLNCDPSGETSTNRYEGAGVIFSSAQSNISKVSFINGPLDSYGNGNFEANLTLQTYNGSAWSTVSGWTLSPTYPYSSAAAGQTYTFTGSALNNVYGIRVVGEVRVASIDNSWSWTVNEVEIFSSGTTQNFSISSSPTSQSITAGGNAQYAVTITPQNGFTGTVNLTVSGLPSGTTGSFSPTSISGGSGTSTLTISTTSSTGAGTYSLTITGTSGLLVQTTKPSLTVNSSSGGSPSGWMGYAWNIDPDGTPIGTGVITSKASNLSVDSNGYLHISISQSGSAWTGAEMFMQQNLGFGTYQWVLQGTNYYNMDAPDVLGLFNYGPANNIGADGSNEIDIEFSKWNGTVGNDNIDFTVYPPTVRGGQSSTDQSYQVSAPSSSTTTVRFVWSSTSVAFYVMSGTVGVNSPATNVLQSYTYNGSTSTIPQTAIPVAINLWAYGAKPTHNITIILQSFSYQP